MVIPIGDDNTDRKIVPVVNYLLIAANVFVFVFLQGLGDNEDFTYAFAAVPEKIITGKDLTTEDRVEENPVTHQRVVVPGLRHTPVSVYLTLLTSMFMHGGIAHLLGNMLFLWIFGDNLEDTLGHMRYLAYYLVCGVLASLAFVYGSWAFGATRWCRPWARRGRFRACCGYILLFPFRRVTVILFRVLTQVPAYVAIGIWFLYQLISSLGVLGSGAQTGGVAYGAHIGGFVAGLGLVKVFAIGRGTKSWGPPARRRPGDW
jgi:membrane associated rhomboid family serine protease